MFAKIILAVMLSLITTHVSFADSENDLYEIKIWDKQTSEGTAIGELEEITTTGSEEDLMELADLGMGALIHKANLTCSVLHVTINENAKTQTMSATCDGNLVFGPVLTSTGKGGSTPNGTFTVYNKIYMAYSGKYNNAPMARFLVFKDCGAHRPNCIGIHATVKKNYKHLGSPASHGCVRLNMENAVALWNLANASATVTVTVL